MECVSCNRFKDCSYKLDATSAMEAAQGKFNYISGLNCPKDWHDKKIEDMTTEQLREAVKELREKLLDSIKPSWSDNATCSSDNVTEYKADFRKPPLGCKPASISSADRIKALSEAITRNIEDTANIQLIDKWAREIVLQCKIAIECS